MIVFPTKYKCLDKQIFEWNDYKLIPIRYSDRFKIMNWRNEQIYHLRQKVKLNQDEQTLYFKNELSTLFKKSFPNQILFSFLENDNLIGYGGFVHIDWKLKTAEISFLMDTKLEKKYFLDLWNIFLIMIENIGFKHINFNKIYTKSFDVRPKLYDVLKKRNFIFYDQDINLKDSKTKNNFLLTHLKFNDNLFYRDAIKQDIELLFKWSNEKLTRKNSIKKEKILLEDHKIWFENRFQESDKGRLFIFYQREPIGFLSLEEISLGKKISFNVAKRHRGKGYGFRMINKIITDFKHFNFVAQVIDYNHFSSKIFKKNGFLEIKKEIINGEAVLTYYKPSYV